MNLLLKVFLFASLFLLPNSFCYAQFFPIEKELAERAENDDVNALFSIGKLFYDYNVHHSYDKEALAYLSRASEKKHLHASALLAVLHKRMDNDTEASLFFKTISKELLRSAQAGASDSQVLMGLACGWGLLEKCSPEETTSWYRKAAEQGNADGQFYLAWRYREGKGVAKDLKQSFHWLLQAAEQGHFRAQNTLGFCYNNGEGVARSYSDAVSWYYRSAQQGYSWGEYNLGYNYIKGKGVPKDLEKGVEWYTRAADQKHLWAMNNLGLCFRDGNGTPKDLERAFTLFEAAAWKKYAHAQYNVGLCYENGWGTQRNHAKAIEWYSKAANQGHKKAKEALDWLQ